MSVINFRGQNRKLDAAKAEFEAAMQANGLEIPCGGVIADGEFNAVMRVIVATMGRATARIASIWTETFLTVGSNITEPA